MFADNASLKFYTPEEFFLGEKPRKYEMIRMSEKLFPEINYNISPNYLNFQVIMLYAPPVENPL